MYVADQQILLVHVGGTPEGSPSPSPLPLPRRTPPKQARQQQQQQQQQQEALTPQTASQLTTYFPLAIAGMWTGAEQHNTANPPTPGAAGTAATANGHATSAPGFSLEPQPILGLHWLDQDALLVVQQQGLSTQLLVLDASLSIREQVEWMDAPVNRGLVSGAADCGAALAGLGPRVYLLGAQGVFCGRLMAWSERLKTLQVGRGVGHAASWLVCSIVASSTVCLCYKQHVPPCHNNNRQQVVRALCELASCRRWQGTPLSTQCQ